MIRIKCPAKINLDLKVFKKNEKTLFHPIKSKMQAISLFDFLTMELIEEKRIKLSGNNSEIPYDEKNLCYKAAELFFGEINYQKGVRIFIEKNIPVCAGLAGGSSNAAGVLFGLNRLFSSPLNWDSLNRLALLLGSDLNFCLVGGTKLCEGRGEKITNLPFEDFRLTIVKPRNLKISAKSAYEAFDKLKKPSDMANDLEFALLNDERGDYSELRFLSSLGLRMSGSGPSYFLINKKPDYEFDSENYQVIEGLRSINFGVCEAV